MPDLPIEMQLAGLGSPEGLPAMSGTDSILFVPPDVQVIKRKDITGLLYPVPEMIAELADVRLAGVDRSGTVLTPAEVTRNRSLSSDAWASLKLAELKSKGWEVPEDPRHLLVDMSQFTMLKRCGWQEKSVDSGLLEAFVPLAGASDDQVKRFALTWGPLWVCAGKGPAHGFCFWSWEGSYRGGLGRRTRNPCMWRALESTDQFRREAMRLHGVLKGFSELKAGHAVSQTLWASIGFSPEIAEMKEYLDHGRQYVELFALVNSFLFHLPGKPGFFLEPGHAGHPQLTISTGLGFLRRAWLQAAQALGGAHGFYFCDGCGRGYLRTAMRRVRRGNRNYCPECGRNDGYRLSKRTHWKEKRSTAKS